MDSERFKQAVVEAIAKRAGYVCTNPDCGALTTGPAETAGAAVNLGEAAHIFGARPGSARYSNSMSDAERSDITNAIWLCRNCHKRVDTDSAQFTSELLFEWKREHERAMVFRLGKPGAIMRQRVTDQKIEKFKRYSYLAQQIIVDQPLGWELKLTAELIRNGLEPTKFRWESLKKGLYIRPVTQVPSDEVVKWLEIRFFIIIRVVAALERLVSDELMAAWGPLGAPGSETQICRVCDLIAEACEHVLAWEEVVHFAVVPIPFERAKELLCGIGGPIINKIFELAPWIMNIIELGENSGPHRLVVEFSLPEGWVEEYHQALRVAEMELGF